MQTGATVITIVSSNTLNREDSMADSSRSSGRLVAWEEVAHSCLGHLIDDEARLVDAQGCVLETQVPTRENEARVLEYQGRAREN